MASRRLWARYALEPPWMEPRGPVCAELGPGGEVTGYGNGCGPGAPVVGDAVVMPALCDAHIHAPDAAIADAGEDLGLHELVSQPRGLKYRLLSDTPPTALRTGLASLAELLRRQGVRAAAVYLENGWETTPMAVEVLEAAGVAVQPLPQPWEKKAPEMHALLRAWRGLGLDTVFDVEEWELRSLAAAARGAGGQLHVHASEDPALAAMDDLEVAVEAGVTAVVHLTHASPGEALSAAEAGAALVYCPVSNHYHLGALPDPRGIIVAAEAGLPVGLGSDNAAWPPPSPAYTMSASYLLLRPRVGGPERRALARSLLYAATTGCHRVLGRDAPLTAYRVPLVDTSLDPVTGVVKRLVLGAPVA